MLPLLLTLLPGIGLLLSALLVELTRFEPPPVLQLPPLPLLEAAGDKVDSTAVGVAMANGANAEYVITGGARAGSDTCNATSRAAAS